MSVGSAGRLAGRIVLPVGIAGAIVGLAAAPALAATSISVSAGGSSLSDGAVLTHNDTISVHGTSDATTSSRNLKIAVNVPGRGAYTLKTGSAGALQSGSLNASLDTGCPDWSASPCTEAPNGSYSFTFSAGGASASQSVTLRVPPATPSGFAASVSGTVASFSWAANSEPDLVGYDILEGSNNDVTPGGLDPSSVCDSSGCSVSVDFGDTAYGSTHSFHIIALRHTSPGSSGSIPSGNSADKSVTFPAAPQPSSSPGSGGGGGGTGGAGGGTGTGGSGHGGGKTKGHHVPGKNPAHDLHASLPTISAGAAPNLPSMITEVKPLPEGTYKPTLAYPDQYSQQSTKAHPPSIASGLTAEWRRGMDLPLLVRAFAGAAILALVAFHLRSWVNRAETE